MRIACWDQQQTWWYSNAVSVIILYFHHRWFSERRYSLNTAKKNREAVFSHTFLKNIIIHVILWEAWERWFALFAFRVKVASDDISFVLRFATGWNGLLKKGKKKVRVRCVLHNEYKLTDDSSGMSLSGKTDWRDLAYITQTEVWYCIKRQFDWIL